MKTWTKIYMDFFGYDVSDFMPCELCGAKGVDIHHIESRGLGGSKNKNGVENLMLLCRSCHEEYGSKKQHMDMLQVKHRAFMLKHG